MNKKELIIGVISFILGCIFIYKGNFFFKPTNKNLVTNVQPTATVKNQELPECVAGLCPQYFSITVDKDWGSAASVVVIPTAMTQGTGKIMIIKKGKVIFESNEMPGIGIDRVDDGDGFILHYSSPRDENLNNVKYSVRYRYKDGKFIIDNNQSLIN